MIRLRFFIAQACLAFLPALLVLLVSREDVQAAADLSVVWAIVGATFSIAYFGQRPYIALRGWRRISARQALSFRVVTTGLACCVAASICSGFELAMRVVAFAVAVKLSEAIVDVWVGVRIRASNDSTSSLLFFLVSACRAVLVGAPIVLLGVGSMFGEPWIVAYLVVLALVFGLGVHLDVRRLGLGGSYRVSWSDLLGYGWELRSFVAGTATCAVLSALPRVLSTQSASEQYAATAVALSIVPVFGLGLQAIWLANLKLLANNVARQARRFALEVIVALVAGAAAWPLWRLVGERIYRLERGVDQDSFAATIVAGFVFLSAQTLANLFKATAYPRNEAFCNIMGALALCAAVLSAQPSIVTALVVAAVVMAAYAAIGMATIVRSEGACRVA